MRHPAIGRLRHRLTLEAASRTPDEGGGACESWSAVATLWASITPTSGAKSVDADAISGRISHEIVFRHRPNVEPVMRLRLGDRVFEIVAVIDIEERKRWLKCLCVERGL